MLLATEIVNELDSVDIDLDIDWTLPSDEELYELDVVATYELEQWLMGFDSDNDELLVAPSYDQAIAPIINEAIANGNSCEAIAPAVEAVKSLWRAKRHA